MKPVYRVGILTVLCSATATVAAAQTPAAVLNKLEVQKLVAAETPDASMRLASHFNGLAAQYVGEARRLRAIGVAARANPNRSASLSAADLWYRRAGRANHWAAAALVLAAFHVDLAAGEPVLVPAGAARLHGGHGAPEPTADELRKIARAARTRGDHLVLEEYFTTVARRRAAEAAGYVNMAASYRAGARKGIHDAAVTCDRLARRARRAEKQATEAAHLHKQLANIG